MPKFPGPPGPEEVRRVRPAYRSLRAETSLARIYARGGKYPTTWNGLRFAGPLAGARFDHHVEGGRRGVMYCARSLVTCVAEAFQGARLVDRFADERCLAIFRLTRSVRLLDLSGDWPTRAGASQAISTGPRSRAQEWSRAIYDAYPSVEGLWYPSSMHGGHPSAVLFERAEDALPVAAELDVPLSHVGLLPDLARGANTLGYLLR